MTEHLDDLEDWINQQWDLSDGSYETLSEVKGDVKDFIKNFDSDHQTGAKAKVAIAAINNFPDKFDDTIIKKAVDKIDEYRVEQLKEFKQNIKTKKLEELESIKQDVNNIQNTFEGETLKQTIKQKNTTLSQIGSRESYLEKIEERKFIAGNLSRGDISNLKASTINTFARQFDISQEQALQILIDRGFEVRENGRFK